MIRDIKVTPKFMLNKDEKLVLGNVLTPNYKILIASELGMLGKLALNRLSEGLIDIFGCDYDENHADVSIVIKISDIIPKSVSKNIEQSYKIVVDDTTVKIIGFGELGLYYGVTSFFQALDVNYDRVEIQKTLIIDYPDLRTRGHFIDSRFGTNLMTLEDWKGVINDMVEKKMNQLVVSLYECWCIQYDNEVSNYVYVDIPKYPRIKSNAVKKYFSPKKGGWVNETVEVPMVKEDFFGDLIKYGLAHGVEVFPLWNSYGHNVLIPTEYPEVAPLMSDGTKSKIAFCISSEKTYQLLFDIYDHIIDKYLKPNNIESFHVGLDEVNSEIGVDVNAPQRIYSPWCECPRCRRLSNEDKIISHAIKLIRYLRDRGIRNVYVYSDVLMEKCDPEKLKEALDRENLTDVTVFDFWTYRNDRSALRFQNLHPELKIRTTVKPMNSYTHCTGCRDFVANSYYLCEMAIRDGAEGLQSYSAWDKTCDINHSAMADFSWNFGDFRSIEGFRRDYARREFGPCFDKAIEALELFNTISSGAPAHNSENVVTSIGTLLKDICSYYGYSCVRDGFDYPRSFPGEAISKIIESRDTYEKTLKEAYKLTDRAYNIFCEIENDGRCNSALAHRYAIEMKNYREIARDYLSFLELYDITKGNAKLTKTMAKKVHSIATERKYAKINLMREMENFKEAYLIPSHLRNLSIIMQVFCDIETFIVNNDFKNVRLDMTDLRPIATKLFYAIR